jgi:hypothetical protein
VTIPYIKGAVTVRNCLSTLKGTVPLCYSGYVCPTLPELRENFEANFSVCFTETQLSVQPHHNA